MATYQKLLSWLHDQFVQLIPEAPRLLVEPVRQAVKMAGVGELAWGEFEFGSQVVQVPAH